MNSEGLILYFSHNSDYYYFFFFWSQHCHLLGHRHFTQFLWGTSKVTLLSCLGGRLGAPTGLVSFMILAMSRCSP